MVTVFLMVIGAGGIVAGITLMSASLKARLWPVVTGRIIERAVGPSTTTGASRPGRYFEPRVTYKFTVNGKTYTGHRISLTTNAYHENKARRVANELPDNIDVYYNPRDPSDALLHPSARVSILMLIGGAISLLAGAWLLFSPSTPLRGEFFFVKTHRDLLAVGDDRPFEKAAFLGEHG